MLLPEQANERGSQDFPVCRPQVVSDWRHTWRAAFLLDLKLGEVLK